MALKCLSVLMISTCKEFSELCGNITVVTSSTSSSDKDTSVSTSNQTQVRPLIYPSELQRLNKQGDIGHAIIVTFGNYPLKTYFSPSFKVPFYHIGQMDTSDLNSNYFDEEEIFYDISNRNKLIYTESNDKKNDIKTESSNEEDAIDTIDNINKSSLLKANSSVSNEASKLNELSEIDKKLFNNNLELLLGQLKLYKDITKISNEELLKIIANKMKG